VDYNIYKQYTCKRDTEVNKSHLQGDDWDWDHAQRHQV